jgi:hypothetical protein
MSTFETRSLFSSRNVGNHPKTRRSIPEESRPWFLFQTLWPQYRLRGTAHPAAIWSKIWKRGTEKSDESRTRRDWAKGENILKWIKGQRISWLGHLERMEDRVPKKNFTQEPEETRTRGRPKKIYNIQYTPTFAVFWWLHLLSVSYRCFEPGFSLP